MSAKKRVGLLAAWAASRAIRGLLFNTSAADPLAFAGAGLALAGVAALACLRLCDDRTIT